jgi:hypothetical protein
LVEEVTVLVKDLYAHIVAVGHVEPPPRIQGNGMWQAEVAWFRAELAPGLDEPAIPVEMDYASIAVAVRDKNVPLGRDNHVGRPVEMALVAAWLAARAQRADHLPLRRTLQHDMIARVSQPDVALVVELHLVRRVE